jgi:hypothetical protein
MHSILSHFNKVRATSKSGSYNCLCPAHDDSSASLSIKICEDGRVLIHCFAGCDIQNILGAVGLSLDDIVPQRIDLLKPIGKAYNPFAILKNMKDEALFVYMCASHIEQGEKLETSDKQKLLDTITKLKEAYEYASR